MRPITFSTGELLSLSPEEIAGHILNLSRWPDFLGYGVVPGIRSAEFERRTPEVVGTRIKVVGTDGSVHVEEIVEWEPTRRMALWMGEFSAPLGWFSTHFDEAWEISPRGVKTQVDRTFEMYPRSLFWGPVLWVISLFLRRSIARNLRQMRRNSEKEAG